MPQDAIRLIVSLRGEDHSSALVEPPALEPLSEALSDLYARLGCEASGREVRAEALLSERPGPPPTVYFGGDDEASPEEVAEELWAALRVRLASRDR